MKDLIIIGDSKGLSVCALLLCISNKHEEVTLIDVENEFDLLQTIKEEKQRDIEIKHYEEYVLKANVYDTNSFLISSMPKSYSNLASRFKSALPTRKPSKRRFDYVRPKNIC